MRVRSVQLVCIIVLLGSLRMAGASVLPGGEFGMGGRYVGSVLCQDCAGVWTEITLVDTGPNGTSGNGTFVLVERFTGGIHRGSTVSRQDSWRTVQWNSPSKRVELRRLIPQSQPHFVVTGADSGTTLHARVDNTFTLALPVASLAAYQTAWTMKPPAAQCMTLYAVTGPGSGDGSTSDFELKSAAPGKVELQSEGEEQ